MFWFLIPLITGFAFNSASAFTTFFSARLGERGGRRACIILRDVMGIPCWAAGYCLAALASFPNLFTPNLPILILAWLLIACGSLIIMIGLVSLRWKAAAPSIKDTLVMSGLYAHIRHPLYSGMLLQLAGVFLCLPHSGMLLACLIGVIWVLIQTKLEEIDLLQRSPAYKEYMQHVPPFVPRLR